jgi:ATP-dependent RNA helicase RhlE
MLFSDFGLSQSLLRAVGDEGYDTPTPIQVMAIPHVLGGRDLLGCAQTGTGKTAAFALPILERLAHAPPIKGRRRPRVLVLTPTRELAAQIGASFGTYGRHTGLSHAVVYGGVSITRQIQALARGVDVLVATPGRLLDLMDQGAVSLTELSVFVLDEADRMLDMGFIMDVKRIVQALPKRRQTLLFSATMPESIRALSQSLLSNPVEVAATPVATSAETVDQRVYYVEKADKRRLLAWLLKDPLIDRALVFTRTKHGANRVAEHLEKAGIAADAIHGNKSQGARERALACFKQGELRVLVATDIAARGIDIDGLALVINYDLPNVPESYVHRIGRTGRAGAIGHAVSFCEAEERPYLKGIERLIRKHIDVVAPHPYPSPLGVPVATDLSARSTPRDPVPQLPRGQQPRAASGHRHRSANASRHNGSRAQRSAR